jgi:hypothetical protein
MSLAVSLQHRLDALRKKCSTGYGCGSACISLRKECQITPRSAIGKERMKRLLELAAGGASSQRGIAQVRQKEAGELAGAIATRRGEKAGQLRSGRQQVAAEKAKAAAEKQAAEAAAAKAATPPSSTGKAPAGTPRGEADRAAKEGDPDYEFARASAVGNAGEDIVDSARHRRNAFRTIEEAEASGQVEKILTRDILIKNFPTDLISGVNEGNVLARLEAHYSLKTFPNLAAKDVESYTEGVARRKRNSAEYDRATGRKPTSDEQAVDAKTVRKQYFDAFQEVRTFVEENKDMPPGKLRMALGQRVGGIIDRIRGLEGSGYTRTYRDSFNPAANALVPMQKRLMMSGRSTSTVYGQMNEFAWNQGTRSPAMKATDEGYALIPLLSMAGQAQRLPEAAKGASEFVAMAREKATDAEMAFGRVIAAHDLAWEEANEKKVGAKLEKGEFRRRMVEANRLKREEGMPYDMALRDPRVGLEPPLTPEVLARAAEARDAIFGQRELDEMRRELDRRFGGRA